jgi:outer membrane receptor protein involved in Fe transport
MTTIFSAGRVGRAALFASAGLAALALATPVYAQDVAGDNPPDCPDLNNDGVCDPASTLSNADTTADVPGAIVVTGSRIRRDEFSTIEPLTVISKDEITQSGFISATDALQSTAVTAGAAQINNYFGGFVVDGGTGSNTLGLRNLGPARTLILLNGRRLAPAGTRGSLVAPDLNVLPTAVVERVEILKAGASSIYGSDAVAGVVNIITENQFDGLTLEAQVNVPEIGAGIERRLAATFGINTDRLNVVASAEYRKRNAIRLNDVDYASCPRGGFLTGEGTEFGSGDTFGFDGTPCFTLDNGGVTINTLGVPRRSAISRVTGEVGSFNRLIPAPGVTTGPTPGFLGVDFYSRDTFDPLSQEEEVITPVEIYTGFVSAAYDLDMFGGAELYGEALATRRNSSSTLYRQLSLDYLTGSPLVPEQFRDGVFLNPNETSSGQTVAARAFIGFGLTDTEQEVDYVRIGGGVRGDFFLSNWRYDLYAGKSWSDGTYNAESFLTDRIANSLLVTENADGTFSCANQATFANCVAAPALNADTIGGNLPQAYRDYILQDTVGTSKFRETTYIAQFDGPIVELPAGDVQVALGAEYREQSIDDTPDSNSIQGNLFGLTAAVPTRGSDNVKEAFAEVFVPLLADRPFFENLTLNGSIRWTDYDSYGSDITYKIAGEWEFFPGFGVRGSYGTSYRAPALAEQFLGATTGFIGSGNDPCDNGNFPDTVAEFSPTQQIIAANCAAIGLNVLTFQQNSGITVFRRGGAETGLEAETSTNWSVGVVIQPDLPPSVGDISLALDYFDIEVENGVSSLAGGTILNRCYGDDPFDPNAGFCRFVDRDENNILEVTSGFVNLSTDIVKGFEFNGRAARDLFGGRLVLNGNVTKYTEQSSRLFPEEFLTDSNGTYITPDWVGTLDASYRTGDVVIRYFLEWIDGSEGTAEFFAFDEQTGTVNEPLLEFFNENYLLEVDDYFIHTLSMQFNVEDNLQFTLGVRNFLDADLPEVTAVVTSVANVPLYSGYDLTGRSFFANVTFDF